LKPRALARGVFISYCTAVLALLFFFLVDRLTKFKGLILKSLGRSAIFIYMLSGVLTLVFQKLQMPNLGLPDIVMSGLAIFSVCLMVAYYLNRKKLNIKI
jgi:hypothetical protein